MMIEVPDTYLCYMRQMPTQKINTQKAMRDYNLLSWIGKTDTGYVAEVIIRRALVKRALDLGLIKYNPDRGTWQGVDYHGD